MRKLYIIFSLILITQLNVSCYYVMERDNPYDKKYSSTGSTSSKVAQWGVSISSSSSSSMSEISSLAVDSNGNIFTGATLYNKATYSFGNNVLVTTTSDASGILIKYNSSGIPQWVLILSITYPSIIVDSNDYIIVSAGNSLKKYDTSGTLQWSKTLSFTADCITRDANNNIFVAGIERLAEYNSSGVLQRTQDVSSGSNLARFSSLVVDNDDNLYAAGEIDGTASYSFGNNVTASGTNSISNAFIVKYDSSGLAQWAVSNQYSGTNPTQGAHFDSIALDSGGNIYVVGYMEDYGTWTFASGISFTDGGPVLLKYNSSGAAQWLKYPLCGEYWAVTVDKNDSIYVVGDTYGVCDFGNGVKTSLSETASSTLLVVYNTEGQAQWVSAFQSPIYNTLFWAVVNDVYGNTYVAGSGAGTYSFSTGNSVTVPYSSNYMTNMFLVQFK